VRRSRSGSVLVHVPDHFRHFAAVDWSGAVGERQKGIAVAICTRGDDAPKLVRADERWSRAEVLDWMLGEMPPDTLIGFDLGPALPFADVGAFFPGWNESPADARGLWALVDRLCAEDPHLSVASFVGHAEASRYFRRQREPLGDRFGTAPRGRMRLTELAQLRQGLSPVSNLNLVGAAQVGKSSLSGMRLLHRIQHHLPIWPFDAAPATGSLVVEIYTSIAALAAGRRVGRTKIKSITELNQALAAIGSAPFPGSGAIDDHRSDALLTAAWLRAFAHRPEFWTPAGLDEEIARTEGWTFGVA